MALSAAQVESFPKMSVYGKATSLLVKRGHARNKLDNLSPVIENGKVLLQQPGAPFLPMVQFH